MNRWNVLEDLALYWQGRLLTQVDRDPRSPSFGCGDRNWWHYKIRDFPSIILQQSGYAAWCLADCIPDSASREGLKRVGQGSARFWSRHVARQRSFDEYYPWEQGYPPAAFSSLAMARLVSEGAVDAEDIRPGLMLALRHLTSRFESQAANQQIAGMAALLWIRRLIPHDCDSGAIDRIVEQSLDLQTNEGWFWEYGGPDIGYLSVTIDCLWDAYDATEDERFIEAAERAMVFIDEITSAWPTSIGMHNSRNTDYIVPYGLCRFVDGSRSETSLRAAALVQRLFTDCMAPGHFFAAVDDRYIAHYIGLSVIRGARTLARVEWPEVCAGMQDPPARSPKFFPESGYLRHPEGLISLHKGGVLTIRLQNGDTFSDYGWSLRLGKRHFVTHWWSNDWKLREIDEGWEVTGAWVPCAYIESGPVKHAILRVGAFLFGNKLIGRLKRALIFRPHQSALGFRRVIHWDEHEIRIEDEITGLPAGVEPQRAPRSSCRHVASADSFHREDLSLTSSAKFSVHEERRTGKGRFLVQTVVSM